MLSSCDVQDAVASASTSAPTSTPDAIGFSGGTVSALSDAAASSAASGTPSTTSARGPTSARASSIETAYRAAPQATLLTAARTAGSHSECMARSRRKAKGSTTGQAGAKGCTASRPRGLWMRRPTLRVMITRSSSRLRRCARSMRAPALCSMDGLMPRKDSSCCGPLTAVCMSADCIPSMVDCSICCTKAPWYDLSGSLLLISTSTSNSTTRSLVTTAPRRHSSCTRASSASNCCTMTVEQRRHTSSSVVHAVMRQREVSWLIRCSGLDASVCGLNTTA
mmetsp:Transcript_6721/g.21285  ORF Transcript_6721/g.21285 Transcript_6721/m.21285 type:complete len:280 (+) Transcript_6721:153-992(+)